MASTGKVGQQNCLVFWVLKRSCDKLLQLDRVHNLLKFELADEEIDCRGSSSTREDKGVVLISIANSLDDGSSLLTHEDGLLAARALHRVGVGVEGHYLPRDVVLNEAEGLARGRVVTVDVRLLPIDGPQKRVVIRSDHVLPDVPQKLFFVLHHGRICPYFLHI